MNQPDLLQEKDKTPGKHIPFTTIFNRKSPNINLVINKHWHLLRTNPEIASAFREKPVIAFRRNKNLRDILGQTHLSKKKKIIPKKHSIDGSSYACLSRANNQCCKQVVSTNRFFQPGNQQKFSNQTQTKLAQSKRHLLRLL